MRWCNRKFGLFFAIIVLWSCEISANIDKQGPLICFESIGSRRKLVQINPKHHRSEETRSYCYLFVYTCKFERYEPHVTSGFNYVHQNVTEADLVKRNSSEWMCVLSICNAKCLCAKDYCNLDVHGFLMELQTLTKVGSNYTRPRPTHPEFWNRGRWGYTPKDIEVAQFIVDTYNETRIRNDTGIPTYEELMGTGVAATTASSTTAQPTCPTHTCPTSKPCATTTQVCTCTSSTTPETSTSTTVVSTTTTITTILPTSTASASTTTSTPQTKSSTSTTTTTPQTTSTTSTTHTTTSTDSSTRSLTLPTQSGTVPTSRRPSNINNVSASTSGSTTTTTHLPPQVPPRRPRVQQKSTKKLTLYPTLIAILLFLVL